MIVFNPPTFWCLSIILILKMETGWGEMICPDSYQVFLPPILHTSHTLMQLQNGFCLFYWLQILEWKRPGEK